MHPIINGESGGCSQIGKLLQRSALNEFIDAGIAAAQTGAARDITESLVSQFTD